MREGQSVDDGDQLELERGVLVEVGECLERTETDLTELLDKRKSSSAASPARTLYRQPSAAPNGTASFAVPSTRIKSLNDVLGRNRTPIGRAVLPVISPFEIRTENHRTVSDSVALEQPSKRRKRSPVLDDGLETDRDGAIPATDHRTGTSLRRTVKSRTDRALKATIKTIPQNEASITFQPASALKITERSRKGPKQNLSSNQKSIAAMFQGETSVAMFPLSAENPRKKLMCLETTKQSRAQKSPRHETPSASGDFFVDQHESDPFVGAVDSSTVPMGGISRPVPVKTNPLTQISGNCTMELEFIPSTSTMRVLEESFHETDIPPSSQREPKSIVDFFQPSQAPAEAPSDYKENSGQSAQIRTLLRSLSNVESGAPQIGASSRNPPPIPAAVPGAGSASRSRPAARGLPKSVSDTSALRTRPSSRPLQTRLMMTSNIRPVDAVEEEEDKGGPWTVEALDLFDWWPPGRPKPES